MTSEPEATPPRAGTYPLPSLHIQGFRAFRDLKLPNLGRVNLIVGKNNVGKSTLLEAVKLYSAGRDAVHTLVKLLTERQEFQRPPPQDDRTPLVDVQRAFYSEHSSSPDTQAAIYIGSIEADEKEADFQFSLTQSRRRIGTSPTFVFNFGPGPRQSLRVSDINDYLANYPLTGETELNCHHIPSRGMNSLQLEWLWDSIVLTDQEQDVLRALQIITPEVERISLAELHKLSTGERIPIVRKKGSRFPEPLRSMGDGMNRLFELSLGLVNSTGGIFLVDELENGVHYSVQEQLWRLIFEASHQLNVQVFATTHSWDCIESFQRAASTHKEAGTLISLARQNGEVKASVFNERDLEIITRESIEVR